MKLFSVSECLETVEGINSKKIVIPFGDGMMKLMAGIEEGVCIKTADIITIKDGTQRVVREGRDRDSRSLIHIACPGGAQLRLFANTVEESLDKWGAVVRQPRPFEHAVGVVLIHQDEKGALVGLAPRASIRMSFDGHRPKGTPPQAVVLWSGRYDANRPTAGLSAFARNNRL